MQTKSRFIEEDRTEEPPEAGSVPGEGDHRDGSVVPGIHSNVRQIVATSPCAIILEPHVSNVPGYVLEVHHQGVPVVKRLGRQGNLSSGQRTCWSVVLCICGATVAL